MEMTSKEIVRRAIRRQRPSRLPFAGDLFSGVGSKCAEGFVLTGTGIDEWGCVWGQTEVPNMGLVTKHPLEDIRKLDAHPLPDYTGDARYSDDEVGIRVAERGGKYIMASIFMVLFERMHALHGFENTLDDLYLDRPAMEALADRIVDVQLTLVREISRRFPDRIDGWIMSDDWGTQTNSFISYDLWMDFFYPRYKRIFDAMHVSGCDVWVHSCGRINDIIEGYILAGVNVVNLLQPRALGIEEIGRRYRGRIAFNSCADIQATLPSGDRRKIEEDIEALMTHWASADGGFIYTGYSGAAIGVHDASLVSFMDDTFSTWSEKLYGLPLPPRTP
ncbi:MAG: uroporphyrinogen decarboxylase family protein [Victivallales bacterium]